ncbi:MAG: glycoside hydrolase family 2 TIM barrel-domain containing protein [Gracilimonas sp.]
MQRNYSFLKSLLILSLVLFSACSTTNNNDPKGPTEVRIEENSGSFSLYVDDEPFFIKGAGGQEYLDKLTEYGGNSIRTWGADNAQEILDAAHEYGIKVTLGLWVGHERHGFNYNNEEAVQAQLELFTQYVEQFKDHPALLMWGIGNEMELNASNMKVWYAVNDIAKMIKEKDPNHPTMTVVAEISEQKIDYLNEQVPDVDILGINSYGGLGSIPERVRRFGWEKPYIVTEWGPNGQWEVGKTQWDAPIEQTSSEKASVYQERYENVILEDNEMCLGSYVFLWGQKQEATPTWYGLFLDTGEETPAVDVMHYEWSGEWPENQAPEVNNIRINGRSANQNVRMEIDKVGSASVEASDPDNDELTFEFVVAYESTSNSVGGDPEDRPGEIPGLIISSDVDGNASFASPEEPGAYRLFVYIFDGNGNAGTANIPFYVQ